MAPRSPRRLAQHTGGLVKRSIGPVTRAWRTPLAREPVECRHGHGHPPARRALPSRWPATRPAPGPVPSARRPAPTSRSPCRTVAQAPVRRRVRRTSPPLRGSQEMRARDDLLAGVAALAHAVGAQALQQSCCGFHAWAPRPVPGAAGRVAMSAPAQVCSKSGPPASSRPAPDAQHLFAGRRRACPVRPCLHTPCRLRTLRTQRLADSPETGSVSATSTVICCGTSARRSATTWRDRRRAGSARQSRHPAAAARTAHTALRRQPAVPLPLAVGQPATSFMKLRMRKAERIGPDSTAHPLAGQGLEDGFGRVGLSAHG